MILLDPNDRRPIYEQIVEKLSELMIRGVLEENSALPSVRNLAAELSINPNTVQRAYLELDRLGYTHTIKGKGSFVSDLKGIKEKRMENMKQEFRHFVTEMKSAGLKEEQLLSEIRAIYEGSGEGGDKK